MSEPSIVHRACPFCEATCGVAITVDGDTIVSVRGDKEDPFSQGFICPKAYGLKELYEDGDRLRRPLKRTGSGWQEIEWQTAVNEIADRMIAIREKHGNDAIGMYTGNPVVHDYGALLYRPVFQRALATRNLFNSAAIDTLPKIVQTALMFGRPFPTAVPVPDIDRTDHLLIIGANPVVSHGSLMSMPNAPGRLKGVSDRGGKVVVLDPRRSETAELADEHHFIRPGSDAALLLAMIHTLFEEGLVSLGAAEGLTRDLDEVEKAAEDFSPETVSNHCGIAATEIRRLAREFAAAESAACYGRLGTCVQEFGTLASWGCDLLNILTGNLDRPGGVMFTQPAAPIDAAFPPTKGFEINRWQSRVSHQPEVGGLVPSSTMAEEILTPGDGQVHAMFLLMTNPLRSAANSTQLERAFKQLDLIVAVDFYINETTQYADYILPTPSPAEHEHFDIGLNYLTVRNMAKWSNGIGAAQGDLPHSWEILATLGARLMGFEGMALSDIDDFILRQYADAALETNIQWQDLTTDEIVGKLDSPRGPQRLVDLLIRLGHYGDGFGRNPEGLTLEKVQASDHGLDLGALQPRLAEIINTDSGKIELAPPTMIDDLPRLQDRMRQTPDSMLLIGRRDLRSTNSFTHNLAALVKGPDRCTLQINPKDATRLGLVDGQSARITSRVGTVVAPVVITEELMPGVASLPHGWGHDAEGSQMQVAENHPGINSNVLTDDQAYDVASGAAILFGTPVQIEPAPQ